MTTIAPTLQAWFAQRLTSQKRASGHTIGAYRDTFRLLLRFAQQQTGKAPSTLDFDDLNVELISAFLDHLEHERHNSVRTRNARLAAIHSMYRFAALSHPEHSALIQRVLAVPTKRFERNEVSYLQDHEIDTLLAAPDRTTWTGRRDHALLVTAVQTGLRVSELIGLTCEDVQLGKGAHLQCWGKGRKQRSTPLGPHSVQVLRVWLKERRGQPDDPLFPTSRGKPLGPDAIAWLVNKHAATAKLSCPSMANKTVTPHVLRHTTAMSLLRSGSDAIVVALWLGHESVETTNIYTHADPAIKEQALARTRPPATKPGRYRPTDQLLAFLESL
jgi:site-specific recombinase XerD